MPKVSIIVNCFNGEKYLKQALDSIYRQTYRDWEIIFWDNCSTDKSAIIANSYDDKLRYFLGSKNICLGAARALATKEASGHWLAFLDVDDFWYENKLEIQISAINGKDVALCYGGVEEVDAHSKILRKKIPKYFYGDMLAKQLNQFDINMVTPLINKSYLIKYEINFNPLITASEEYNLFIRVLAKGNGLSIDKILGAYRTGENSLTNRQISEWEKERVYTLEQVQNENPGIYYDYKDGFDEAYCRSKYYRARYLMSIEDKWAANKVLYNIALKSKKYFILYIFSFSKIAWDLLHSDYIKRSL